ncbi:TcpQ domain-containing protein [Pigmentiphaga kullae]|uniref:Conjugative transfer protein CagX n=1 Tax=Pigmentiphaga kullae TaxID=151784 RepID=A0A4Q7NPL9_9BURK|nr:TcpQ domain-containing protein [Pigmentiphaga kullae]RZS86520.1 conjugative transfer protein CagX [Pigmentiphaga kullae]
MHPCRIAVSVAASLVCGAVTAQVLPAAPAGVDGAFDFSYRIAGDKRVAPVQVFDDGRQTYLQFRVGQVLPAVFSVGPQGERLAPVAWQGGYAVVAGTAREYLLRIGEVVARAQYHGHGARLAADGFSRGEGYPSGSDEPSFAAMKPLEPARTHVAAPGAGRASVVDPVSVRRAPYDATPADRTMRQALRRWATAAGWTFEPEHWTVDVDIPLAGSANLGSDFKTAVRELLASTELSAHPLQPCFYSNRVLRVVPHAESCDRTSAPAGRQG